MNSREKRIKSLRHHNAKHGMEGTTEYRIWVDMRRRCHGPQRPDFKNYGARGITVCEEWRDDFAAFFADMGFRPAGHTLDRRDNEQGYSAENCMWSPRKAQERNKRTSRIITVKGERMTVAEASERFGVGYYTLYSRINIRGWDEERAALTPVR